MLVVQPLWKKSGHPQALELINSCTYTTKDIIYESSWQHCFMWRKDETNNPTVHQW